ncbi:MAG TPA: methyltransferase domain-containing protein [Candidatus Aminicenantes bacterium]|nr:methyltransferase domain-containing protein [Candidatus Aminicenantes bacterium]
MSEQRKHRVCPVEKAGMLDHPLRRLFENPARILGPFVAEGMSVLDFGCGPGYFTLELARLVGPSGHVTAVDLQPGMLAKARQKLDQAGLGERVTFRAIRADAIGAVGPFAFALVFHVLHEVPEPARFLGELRSLLAPGRRALLAEPGYHIGRREFSVSLDLARRAGLNVGPGPRILFNRTAILEN